MAQTTRNIFSWLSTRFQYGWTGPALKLHEVGDGRSHQPLHLYRRSVARVRHSRYETYSRGLSHDSNTSGQGRRFNCMKLATSAASSGKSQCAEGTVQMTRNMFCGSDRSSLAQNSFSRFIMMLVSGIMVWDESGKG